MFIFIFILTSVALFNIIFDILHIATFIKTPKCTETKSRFNRFIRSFSLLINIVVFIGGILYMLSEILVEVFTT